jgi:hypothetical protein
MARSTVSWRSGVSVVNAPPCAAFAAASTSFRPSVSIFRSAGVMNSP